MEAKEIKRNKKKHAANGSEMVILSYASLAFLSMISRWKSSAIFAD
jgi:hypothetical protein